jgi:bis(5'-nucleosyl)-tetraphosphatase (symmetrical)
MAVYAVGDLQGCYDELRRLLERLNFDPARDRLWLTGDLVNRGPASLAVLRFVRGLGDAATVVLGNHDLHLLAVARTPKRLKRSDTLTEVLEAPDRDELLAWLAALPLAHFDPGLGTAMVHAGLAPEWDIPTTLALAREVGAALAGEPESFFGSMYGDEPDHWSDALHGADRLRFAVNCLTRLRVVTPDGRLVLAHKGTLAKAPDGSVAWFRAPGRRSLGTRIVFGHWSALGYYDGDGVLGLDTGCAWGAELTAVRLDAPMSPVHLPCAEGRPFDAPENA